MWAVKNLLSFSAGIGIGLGIGVLATPHAGVAKRRVRGRRFAGAQAAARMQHLAEQYAGDSATDEGMAEGPVELRR